MLIRYDFYSKLDLSRFQKQALHYIANMSKMKMSDMTYHLVINDYKIVSDIRKTNSDYLVALQIFDLKRDGDKDIIESKPVMPMNDPRFNEMKDFKEIFSIDHTTGDFTTDKVEVIIEKLCKMLKMLNKLNAMKAFF